jgi:uncharacterized protein YraI
VPLVLNVAANVVIRSIPSVSLLPVPGPQYSGYVYIVTGNPTRLYVCMQNSQGVWQWINAATTL